MNTSAASARRRRRRSMPWAASSKPTTSSPTRSRRRARAAGAAPRARPVGPRDRASGGARRRRASAARRVNASATSGRFVRPRQPRIGPQRVEAEARRRLQRPVARVVLEQERARSAGDVERVLVQMRQQIVRRARCAPAATSAAAGQCRHRPFPGRRPGASTAWFVVLGTSCSVWRSARTRPRFYCDRSICTAIDRPNSVAVSRTATTPFSYNPISVSLLACYTL